MAKVPWDDASKLFAKYLSKEIKKAAGKSSRLTSKPNAGSVVRATTKPKPAKSAADIKKSVGKSKVVNGKLKVVRGDYLKSTRSVREPVQGSRAGNFPSSSMPSKVKPTSKRNVKTQSQDKAKSVGEGVDAAKNMKTTKVVKTPPKPKRTYLKTKDREVTLSPTEQREAERQATRLIRRSGDRPAYNPQPTSGQRPVGRPAPSSTTASKRTRGMSKDKGNNSRGRFEADKTKSEIADDKKQFGKGQPMPKKKNVPPRKGAKPIIVGGKFKPVRGDKLKSTSSVRNSVDDWIDYPSSKIKSKPTKKSPAKKAPARKKPEPTSRYRTDTGTNLKSLRDNINKAETPAQKRAAKKARIEWLKKNGMKP